MTSALKNPIDQELSTRNLEAESKIVINNGQDSSSSNSSKDRNNYGGVSSNNGTFRYQLRQPYAKIGERV